MKSNLSTTHGLGPDARDFPRNICIIRPTEESAMLYCTAVTKTTRESVARMHLGPQELSERAVQLLQASSCKLGGVLRLCIYHLLVRACSASRGDRSLSR